MQKYKVCTFCGGDFVQFRPMQRVCSVVCAGRLVKAAKKEEKERDRARKEEMKGIPELKTEAQEIFNRYIRARDIDKGCFVCGKPFPRGQLGGDFDAGHVRSRGAADHLRYTEDNVHGECKECNASFGAKPHQIEAGAVARIGRERFEELKNDNQSHKWTRDELRAVKAAYRQKLKDLQKGME